MPRKKTVREAVKGANYTTRGRGSKIEYTNNAWRIPRGTPRGSFDTYEHKRLRCSPKDNYLVGWTPKMTNAQVAKLVGQNKRDCYVRGIKVAYRLLDPYGWQSGPRLGARKRPPPDPPWSVKKSPVPKQSPPQSAKTSPVSKQSPPQSAKTSPVPKRSPPQSVKKSPVPKQSPPKSAKTSPVPKQSPPKSAKKSPAPKLSPRRSSRIRRTPMKYR